MDRISNWAGTELDIRPDSEYKAEIRLDNENLPENTS